MMRMNMSVAITSAKLPYTPTCPTPPSTPLKYPMKQKLTDPQDDHTPPLALLPANMHRVLKQCFIFRAKVQHHREGPSPLMVWL